MVMIPQASLILYSKLSRPTLGSSLIERPALMGRLNTGQERAMTLVSAPAGFGKSTLISQWVRSLEPEWNCGWYSVDDADDTLSVFFLYLVTAIRELEPDACSESMELAMLEALPDPAMVARVFINEVLKLKKKFLFVIDDFHRLHDPAIHNFLTTLLSYPPPNFHWVILSRRDPDLPLNKMRMVGSLQEIRMSDLRFSGEETKLFLQSSLDEELSDEMIDLAKDKLDGWAVAVRMMVMSMSQQRGDLALRSLPEEVSGSLIEEIFTDVPVSYRELVIQMALFDRFSKGLSLSVSPDLNVDDFYNWLPSTNMFVINRDKEDGWFRFHPFFREALLKLLTKRKSEDEIKVMHQRAAAYFNEAGMVQEAISEAMLGGNDTLAGEIVENHLQRPEWQGSHFTRDQWLAGLTSPICKNSPVLMIENVWKKYRANVDWVTAFEFADAKLKNAKLTESSQHWIHANLACLGCAYHYTKRDFSKAITMGNQALEMLAPEQTYLRATTVGLLSLSYRSDGQNAEALQVIRTGRELCQSDPAAVAVIQIADCHQYLMSMDMPGLEASAEHCCQYCEQHQLLPVRDMARILAGFACYQMNELTRAEQHLLHTELELARMDFRNVVWSQGYLALTYAAQDRWQDADSLVSQLLNQVRTQPNPLFVGIVEALQTEFELRRGKVSKAQHRLAQCAAPVCESKIINLTPVAGYLRVLISLDDAKSRAVAKSMIETMLDDAQKLRLTEVQVQFLILKALWHVRGGAQAEGLVALGDAVRMAQHGGALRVFADFGAELIPLLQRLKLDTEGVEYVGSVVRAIHLPANDEPKVDAAQIQSTIHMPLMESLSKREFEVLLLLAKHCSNNDISDQLFISLGTVKRHVSNIYQKLAVHGRKEAVAKAVGLGLIK